jgi:sensor domain CHASE-containing protein/GAF domain-containing protein
MKLHRKIAINLALVVTALILVFYFLSSFVLVSEFTALEYREAQGSMERVFSVYSSEILDLRDTTKDWASWDDTYEFMETFSPEYLSSNLGNGTFVNNRIDILLYVNRSGGLLYGKTYDHQHAKETYLSEGLMASLATYGLIDAVLEDGAGQSGLISIPDEEPLLVAAMPVLRSDNTGPSRGVLIMGRFLNEGIIAHLEGLTSLPLVRVEADSVPLEIQEMYNELPREKPYLIFPANQTQLTGYLFICDLKGFPASIFQVALPRDFSLQGKEVTNYFFSLLIAVAFIFGTIVMIVLETNVLSRIAILSTSVIDIGRRGDLQSRVPDEGDDEISTFAREINRMLRALMEADRAINTQNRQLTAVNEIISTVSHSETTDELFTTSLRKTMEMLGFTMGAIFSLNLETKQAELKTHAGISPEKLPDFLAAVSRVDFLQSPHAPVFTSAIPIYYEGISGDEPDKNRFPVLAMLEVSSLAIVPLTAGSAVLGGMYIACRDPHRFSEYEREILAAIGKEIGNALFKGVLQDKLVAAMTRAEISNERAQKANDEANFYLDIMTHDINNVNQAALGYTMLLSDALEESQESLVNKLENTILKSSDIIHQVSIIRRIQETDSTVKKVNLDAAIEDVLHHFSDAHITYDRSALWVYADELMPEIFMNLIGNALKFGGTDIQIVIGVVPGQDEVEVSIRDDGPGISDSLKPLLFKKFQRGSTSKSGKGLGLYIVRMLVERYGGRVWVEDAISGTPESGTVIKFTLKKALPE